MIPHTIREGYNWSKWEDKFVGFDIWSIGRDEFLSPDVSERIFREIGIPFTEVLDSYSVDEWGRGDTEFHDENGNWLQNDEWRPESSFGDGLAEGIVMKNTTTQAYAKMVREDFREKHKTGDMKKSESGAQKLSYQYVPDARIEKTAYKLVDEGEWEELNMRMMQDLPKAVIEDMVEEEGYNIFVNENWEVDLSKFRSVTSDRCSRVLKKLINLDS
jgi:hypothetical protein